MSDTGPNISDDEFDVEIFIRKLYHIFLKGIRKLFSPVRILFAKPLVLLSFIFAGIVVALILKLMVPPVYKASFLIKPQNKADVYYLNLLNDIYLFVKEDDTEGLQRELQLEKNTAKNFVKIDVSPVKKNKVTDTISAVEIFIYTKDIAGFDTIQNSILHYLENSPYYVKLKNVHQQEIALMEKKLNTDMLEIDSLKRLLAQNIQPRGNGGFVYGEPIDPVRVYEEGLNLFRQQQGINWQKQYSNNFELIKPCIVRNKPYTPRLSELLLSCVGISLVLCLIYNYRKL